MNALGDLTGVYLIGFSAFALGEIIIHLFIVKGR